MDNKKIKAQASTFSQTTKSDLTGQSSPTTLSYFVHNTSDAIKSVRFDSLVDL